MTFVQARQLLRQQLGRNDLQLLSADEIPVTTNLFKLYNCRTDDGNVQLQVQHHNGQGDNIKLFCKVYREADNEVVFHETRLYQQIQESFQSTEGVGVRSPIPSLLRQMPAEFFRNRRPVLVTRADNGIPLSMIMRDNDENDVSGKFALAVLLKCLQTFSVLHELDFVHRDVKPEDIILITSSNNCNATLDEERPYRNHPIMNTTDFTVVIQNLDNADRFRKRITHNSTRKRHNRYGFISENAYGSNCWIHCPPTRDAGGRRHPLARRDDLLSILYIIIHLNTGTLPWIDEFVNRAIDVNFETELSHRKRTIMVDEMIGNVDADIADVLELIFIYISDVMTFSSNPPYLQDEENDGWLNLIEGRLNELE